MIPPNELPAVTRVYPNTIFLTVGIDRSKLRQCANEIILVNDYDISDLGSLINQLLGIFSMLHLLDDDILRNNYDFDAIIQAFNPIVVTPISLTDEKLRMISYSKPLSEEYGLVDRYVSNDGYVDEDTFDELTALSNYKDYEYRKGLFSFPTNEAFYHMNIFSDGFYIGRLSTPASTDYVVREYYSWLLETMSDQIAQLYRRVGGFPGNQEISKEELDSFRELVAGYSIKDNRLQAVKRRLAHLEGDELQLYLLKPHSHHVTEIRIHFVLQLEKRQGVICAIDDQQALILVNRSFLERTKVGSFDSLLVPFLRESMLKAAASRPFRDLYTLPEANEQLKIAFDVGELEKPMEWFYNFDDFSFQGLLLFGCSKFSPSSIGSPAINILRNYDAENNTELDTTLKTLLLNKLNATAAMNELNVARSTLVKRLDRITKLTGIDLDDNDDLLYLLMSYKIRQMYERGMDAGNI